MNTHTCAQAQRSQTASAPTRGRVWRRLLGCAVALLLCAILFRFLWGARASARLNLAVAAIAASGEPIRPEDLNPDPVAEDDNAALVLIDAAARVNIERTDDLWSGPYRMSSPAEAEAVARVVEPHAPARALVRSARGRSGVDWGVEFSSPAISILLPQLGPQRNLCRVLGRAAALDVYRGQAASAIETLRDVLFMSRVMEQMPVLISHLVATAEGAVACRVIEDTAARLEVDGPATRAAVAALIVELLDETAARDGLVDALRGERVSVLDSTILLSEGKLPLSGFGGPFLEVGPPSATARARAVLLGPMIRADGVRTLEHMGRVIAAARAGDYPTAARLMPNVDQIRARASLLDRVAALPSLILLPALDRAVLLHYRALANRRMAAVALAIRLYELDHGTRPATLADLVPAYLPAVPRDPFTDHDGPLHYVVDDDTPRLYVLDQDGVDDDGAFASGDRVADPQAGDLIFYLDGRPAD